MTSEQTQITEEKHAVEDMWCQTSVPQADAATSTIDTQSQSQATNTEVKVEDKVC